MSKPIVLIDGSSYLFRAFHALPPLTNSKGEPTGAIHGVLNMLNKLIRETEPDRIAMVFDASGKTFRDDLYAEYKANRPPMPDELRSQIEPLHAIVEAMGIPLLKVKGVEADDVIGTLATLASANKMSALISTSDKDMAQLVNANVTLVNTMSATTMDRDGVHEKFDVWPEQIIDWLALVGDSSDNIPGVPGVGPKTASKWLKKYGSVDEIKANAEEIGGKVGQNLRDNIEQLDMSQTLATIACDVKLPVKLVDLAPAAADVDALRSLYQRFELRTLLRELDAADGESGKRGEIRSKAESPDDPTQANYETVLTDKQLRVWLKRINAAKLTAIDTETDSLDYMAANIVGLSLAVVAGSACYVPLDHRYPGAPKQLDRDKVLKLLKPYLENPKKPKLGHHLKYDAHIFARYDIELRGVAYDSMLESYVLNSTATRHDMDSVARHYLGVETTHYEDVAGKGAKQITFDQVALDEATPYAAEDADVTLQLHAHMWPLIAANDNLSFVYSEIEQPLIDVLTRMEETGVLLDTKLLTKQSTELAKKMAKLESKAHKLAGGPFNLGSPKQLQEILFERLELPVVRKTPKGQPSTAEDVLQELAADYKLPEVILQYRGLSKLKSTYTDKLPLKVAADARVHTSYHQAIAATGRLSSLDPNLQNIPIRTPEGRRIRQAFIAKPGHCLLAADYSQIELRIMAHLSGDAGLTEAFTEDRDVHRATAAEVFGLTLADVGADQRRSAKAINFGLIYGMSAFGLARQLKISRADAQTYIDRYFDRYPGVKAYMDGIREQAAADGYVETVFGRRLYLPEINSRNVQRRQYAERTAINAPMQGTAADIIKIAMIRVQNWLNESAAEARLIMQVHDELVLEVAMDSIDAVTAEVVNFMTAAALLRVPLKVDYGTGTNWDEAH